MVKPETTTHTAVSKEINMALSARIARGIAALSSPASGLLC
jgi:hypothetical protein